MTLERVLNEKFRPHHVRRGGGDDDVDGSGGRPVASLPAPAREAALKSAFKAATVARDAGDEPCIGMSYHSRFFVDNKVESDANDDDGCGDSAEESESDEEEKDGDEENNDTIEKNDGDENLSDESGMLASLRKMLETEDLSTASLLYLTVQGVLVYDRNRGGLILTDKEERFLLFGDAVDISAEDIHLDEDDDDDDDEKKQMHIHEQLTHHVIDEILSYAGDESVGALPQVCSSWRDEVGTRSPQLWKMLLNRHGWPLAANGDEGDAQPGVEISSERHICKIAFISHYTVARDVRALANACNYMNGESGSIPKDKLGVEAALQVFKATKGAPMLEGLAENRPNKETPYCFVKIWSHGDGSANTRALAAYEDCTLRLFEAVGGNSGSGGQGNLGAAPRGTIKCRQIVCVRAAPPSSSRKKDSCRLGSMDVDDDVVACFVEEAREEVVRRNGVPEATDAHVPWITIFSREDIICAGNEGELDEDRIRAHDLRGATLDFLLGGGAAADAPHDELHEALHAYLAAHDGDTEDVGDMEDVHTMISPKLIACGKGHFLFHAHVVIPGYSELGEDDGFHDSFGHRLFLFSASRGSIVKSLQLEKRREGTSLFASRPYRRHASSGSAAALCTNVLVSGPTMAFLSISVEIKRDGTIDLTKSMTVENEEFAPWSKSDAVLTSSHAVFSTDPLWQGPLLHFQRMHSSHDESLAGHFHTIEIPEKESKLHGIFSIREHYIAVIVSIGHGQEVEDNLFDGHWFGEDRGDEVFVAIVYHVPTRQEICRCLIPSETLDFDCVGDTLALNLSHVGFVITGGNARDVARNFLDGDDGQIMTPSGKTPKSKKKRLASLASSKSKKDGFARGMKFHFT